MAFINLFTATCFSIYVVGSKLQAFTTRPNGGLGIHWNLHIGEDENYVFYLCALSLHERGVNVFAIRSHPFFFFTVA